MFKLTTKLALSKNDHQLLYKWYEDYRKNAFDECREIAKKKQDEEKLKEIIEEKGKLEWRLEQAIQGIIELTECKKKKA